MLTTEQVLEKERFLEYEITKACLRGTNMVPNEIDRAYIESLGAQILELSGGRNEVLFDSKGRPSIYVNFFVDEKSRLDYLSGGGTYFTAPTGNRLHPAFIVNNKPTRGFRMGKYQACRVNDVNYPLSLYGLTPAYYINHDSVLNQVIDANSGSDSGVTVHAATRAELSFIGLLSVTEAFQCRGNDSRGKSYAKTDEKGSLCGYMENGAPVHVLTGSGPLTWSHDGTPFGVWDLRGNVCEWAFGYKTMDGELRVFPNNDASIQNNPNDFAITSDKWKAMMPDGSYVAPGTEGTYKYDYTVDPGTEGYKTFCINTVLAHQQTVEAPYGAIALKDMILTSGVSTSWLLQVLLLAPLLTGTPQGSVYMRNIGERAAYVFGDWNDASYAGFCRSNGGYSPSCSNGYIGWRLASTISDSNEK